MIRVSLKERQSQAEQLNEEASTHGSRSTRFLDLRARFVNVLKALGKSEAAAIKCLERDRNKLQRGFALRVVGAPGTLDSNVEPLLLSVINNLAGSGDERSKEVVQVAVQALREQTTENSQPAKLPCARTVKQISKRVALVTASTENTTEARQRAFSSKRDVVTFAAGVLGIENDQHIVHFRFAAVNNPPIAAELAFSTDVFGLGLDKQGNPKQFIGKAFLERLRRDSAITPKVVRVRPRINAFLKIWETICCDGSVFPFVVLVKSSSLNEGDFRWFSIPMFGASKTAESFSYLMVYNASKV